MYANEVVYAHVCLEDDIGFYALLEKGYVGSYHCGLITGNHLLHNCDLSMPVSCHLSCVCFLSSRRSLEDAIALRSSPTITPTLAY